MKYNEPKEAKGPRRAYEPFVSVQAHTPVSRFGHMPGNHGATSGSPPGRGANCRRVGAQWAEASDRRRPMAEKHWRTLFGEVSDLMNTPGMHRGGEALAMASLHQTSATLPPLGHHPASADGTSAAPVSRQAPRGPGEGARDPNNFETTLKSAAKRGPRADRPTRPTTRHPTPTPGGQGRCVGAREHRNRPKIPPCVRASRKGPPTRMGDLCPDNTAGEITHCVSKAEGNRWRMETRHSRPSVRRNATRRSGGKADNAALGARGVAARRGSSPLPFCGRCRQEGPLGDSCLDHIFDDPIRRRGARQLNTTSPLKRGS